MPPPSSLSAAVPPPSSSSAAVPPPSSLSAAMPPPSSLSDQDSKPEDQGSKGMDEFKCVPDSGEFVLLMFLVVRSALEELSRTKAQKANPFAKPKM